MSKIIGIDLGTTYSAVGYVQQGKATILPNGHERIVPSVVGFSPQGRLMVGTPARNQYVLYPENTARSIKRKMGTDETVTLNVRAYTPAEVSAIILREMKRIAEANLGEEVNRAVITVPAYFSDAARRATKDAGEIAGFTVERIINEPTAGALAYGLDRVEGREMVAVYDLGSGTFDVSIVELDSGVIEVRASHGNVHLGGDDFDERLMNLLADRFMAEHGIDPRQDRKALARLIRAAEQAKIELSAQPFARVREEYLVEKHGQPLHLETEVSRVEFEDLIRDLLDQTIEAFEQSLKDAGISASDLDHVLFVGGSTRIPLVWEMVANYAGIAPLVAVNPDEAVALGAGIQAAIIAGEPLDAILVDVTPHSLGIEVAEVFFDRVLPDHYAPIIHRNSAIPASHAQQFSAVYPGQDKVRLKIYQGENDIASRNTLLGEFLFEGLETEDPDDPDEVPSVTVRFDLDLNGILEVTAVDRGSGKKQGITVKAEHRRMNAAEKAASAEHVADLTSAPELLPPAVPQELADLLARARQVLDKGASGADELRDLVAEIDEAIALGLAEEDVPDMTDRLLDALYEVDED
jgi:molecular chaperone DnaK